MTLREMGAPDNSPWHLEHMDLRGPNMEFKEYNKSRPIWIPKSEIKFVMKGKNIVLKFQDMKTTIQQ